MAKQSGLHQIRGKVGEHSYYKQTGVSTGLIRSINQGMSSRVKNGDEYANTRLNNNEFGAAASIAGFLGQMVDPKFRPMILPFSQSNMAKAIIELARQSNLPWGARVVSSADTAELAAILSAQSKRNPQEFLTLSFSRSAATSLSVSADYTASQASLMESLGINYLSVKVVPINLATGKYNNATGKIQKGYIRKGEPEYVIDLEEVDPTGSGSTQNVTVTDGFTPTAELYNGHQFVVVVVMPARMVGGRIYTLQEYCSFLAVELPAQA